MSSIDLGPSPVPYFPRTFFINQFLTKTQWPPSDTNLSRKVAIITGANTGLGLECARQVLSLRLSHLIMAVRTVDKGEAVAAELRERYPTARIDVRALDMSSYDSILAFVKQVDETLDRVDVAILNAGQYNVEYSSNPQTGHEGTIQVNYLSTALLALLLLPILKHKSPKGEPGRLTIVNAALAYVAKLSVQDHEPILKSFDDPKTFVGRNRYPVSKLLMHFFVHKLSLHIKPKDVIINMVCPGLVKGTSLQSRWPRAAQYVANLWKAIPARSVEVGASTYVDAAFVKGEESHGCFLMSWRVAPVRRFADLLYTEEGRHLADDLWKETLEELKFARVEQNLSAMKS